MHNIKQLTFWPSAIFLFLTLMVSWLDAQTFVNITTNLNSQIIAHLPFAFTLSAFAMVLICAYIFVSPVGKIRIGGENAQPILSPFKWFSVSLTTVIAMGILFWSVAEPVIHFNEPAAFSGALRRTDEALSFSVATIFVHWTLAPYAIYTAAGLCFALAYYNFNMPFSARSLLRPVLGDFVEGKSGQLLDSLVLFSVFIGMSATLTAGLLLIGSGITASFGLFAGPFLYALISAFIIGAALISSFTGLRRGIQFLARINTYLFFAALVFVIATGPMDFAFQSALKGMDAYLSEFVSRHLLFDAHDEWPGWWTVAFFASWFAWAPISCLFLGKIAKGYTIRQFILVNLLLPSLFGMLWFGVFGGTSLFYEQQTSGELYNAFQEGGLSAVVYQLFAYLPGTAIVTFLFLGISVISFVTAADSNTDVIGGLCSKEVNEEGHTNNRWVKVFWACNIGLLGWLSASFLGDNGIKMLSNLAGLPGMIIVDISAISLLLLISRLKASDKPKAQPLD